MNAIIIEKESSVITQISSFLRRKKEFNLIGNYIDPILGLNKVMEHLPDIVFLETEFGGACGIEIGRKIKSVNENISIVFLSNKQEYAVKAFEINALDYIMKPIQNRRLTLTMVKLQQTKSYIRMQHDMMVCCFATLYFKGSNQKEVVDVKWRTKKTQELFAYLLHYQQKFIRKDVLIEVLWAHVNAEKGQALLYSAIYQIRKTLREIECPIDIVSDEDAYTLKMNHVKYDVREWEVAMDKLPPLDDNSLSEHIRVIKMYKGDYLEKRDYAWAIPEKDLLRTIWQHHVRQVVDYLDEHKEYMKIIRLYYYIIKIIPQNEEAYFQMMKYADKVNNYEAVMQSYQKLEQMLKQDYGLKPDRKIQKWYKLWLENQALMSDE